MKALFLVFASLISSCFSQSDTEPLNQNPFPDGFQFGVASAAYQIEGAWLVDGKGENIWDRFTNQNPDRILDGSNGNIACDSYYKYKEDVQLVRSLGVDFYRFSISWSRILPTGFMNVINPDGVQYYNNLIDELLTYNITPMITIYHWDLPQPLQDIGGWPNPLLADAFVDFANLAFNEFGNRVKHWITFNEPKQICRLGYGDGSFAPGIPASGVGDYLCAYTILIAHARAYHLYNDVYRPLQNGTIGITVDTSGYFPGSNSAEDVAAALRLFEFDTGIYTNPIFGATGDYPQVVKEFVGNRSRNQGFSSSRLPELTTDEIALIRGTSDFFGLNFYSGVMVADAPESPLTTVSSWSDARVTSWHDPEWPSSASPWLKVVPSSIRIALNRIKDTYGDVPIYVTENGYSDNGGLEDYDRVNYYLTYLSACLEAIYEDNVNLVVYTAWTLMDNFEWLDGYVVRFGLHDVDFDDPERPRTPKLSAGYYTDIVRDKRLPETTLEVPTTTTTTTTVPPSTISTETPTNSTDAPPTTTEDDGLASIYKPIGFVTMMIVFSTLTLL